MLTRRGGSSPSTTCRSVRQTPQTSTRISTSPGPGSGTGRSSRRSGAVATAPGASKTIAFIGITLQDARLRSTAMASWLVLLVRAPLDLDGPPRQPGGQSADRRQDRGEHRPDNAYRQGKLRHRMSPMFDDDAANAPLMDQLLDLLDKLLTSDFDLLDDRSIRHDGFL